MYSKKQRLAALIGIILLAVLYLLTLVFAIFDLDGSGILCKTCLFATIALPILIWVYIWMYGIWTKKHTPASFDFMEGLQPDETPDLADTVKSEIPQVSETESPVPPCSK